MNKRLKKFHFRTFLTQNTNKLIFIMLVHKEKINGFKTYLKDEKKKLLKKLQMVITNMIKKCVCCNSKNLKKVKSFYKPPTKEPDYKIKKYFREIYICCDCGNFHNFSNVNMNKIYENDYSQISYGASLWNKLIKVYNLKKNQIIFIE